MHHIIRQLEADQVKATKTMPAFAPGDTLVVQVKIKEGERFRVQSFEGVVIAKKNRGLNSSFTVTSIITNCNC